MKGNNIPFERHAAIHQSGIQAWTIETLEFCKKEHH